MKTIIIQLTSILPLLLLSLQTMGQGAPPATPIDGGLSILLAAGGAYGLKKLKDHRRNS